MRQVVMILSPIAVGLLVGSAVLIGIGWMKTLAFLQSTPRLSTAADMDLYKSVARFGMWAALGLLALMIPAFLVLIFLPASPAYRMVGLGASGLVTLAGSHLKKKEVMMQETPADSDGLAAERDRVTQSWLKKPFPDF